MNEQLTALDDLAALRLSLEWGADEAILDHPVDRFAATPAYPARRPARADAGPPRLAAPASPPPALRGDLPTLAAAIAAAAHTMPDLLAAMDAFHACPLRATASTTVAPSGNPAARLVLVGPPPGPDDDRAGHAFAGPPGAQLDRVLASAALTRDDLLLVTLIPWRPPGGRPPSDPERAACLPFLHRLLALLEPARIVLLGATPTRALQPDPAPFRRLRGRWGPIAIPGLPTPVQALPTLAPDSWLANATNRELIWTDLLTLKSSLDKPT